MRIFIIISFLLITSFSYGQNVVLPNGEYMDTTSNPTTTCPDYNIYFYQVHGKYPESSSTILKEAQSFLKAQDKSGAGSGYITFQFMIDCEGRKLKKTRVLQQMKSIQIILLTKNL